MKVEEESTNHYKEDKVGDCDMRVVSKRVLLTQILVLVLVMNMIFY